MDPFTAGGDGRHLTWRDLPPTPPTGPIQLTEPAPATGPIEPPLAPSPAPRRRRSRTPLILGAGALVGLLALGGILVVADPLAATDATSPDQTAGAVAPTNPPANPGGSNGGTAQGNGSEPLADTAAKILPSVVQIETGSGLGSGFVADENGDILTAAHVVSGSSQVTIKLQDGSTVSGTVAASDASIDTAVVKVSQSGLPALTLGDSSQVRVGQVAIAVGSPFGLDETVTSGIVSALNRTLQTETGQTLNGLIQTDAPINPGNSGGPLTDRNGAVIGINDAIASTSGQSAGVGFAVPINDAKTLLTKVQSGSLGSQSQPGTGNGQGNSGQGNSGTDPFGGTSPFGNGTSPFGDLNPFGNGNGNSTSPFDGTNPFDSPLFQWFWQQIQPQLNGGQSGSGQ